ncbi:MAG: outer membrane protein assembly factor BamA [Treponema sp.]|nr:outer membrane protein assembly factor BamA [Treponema sp.]
MILKSNKVRGILIAFFLCLICSLVHAQEEDSDWFWGKSISEVSFEGLKGVKKSELVGITNSYIGKAFTEELFNNALDRLYALAYFEEIEPYAKHDPRSRERVILVFRVKEHPVICSISFKGNKKLRNNELREAVSIKTGDVYIESAALLDERSVRDAYIKKGYSNAKVSMVAEETDDGIAVVFQISEGSGTVVSKISFSGNTTFSSKTLRSKMSLKEDGFLKNGAFQRSSLEADKQAIIMYYMTKGYIDARIIDVIEESSFNQKKEREEVSLTVIIQEGAQYTYNGTTIEGNEIFSTEKLLSNIKLKPGDVFNQTKYQEGMSALTNLYYENGYMTNEFHPSINKDSERRTIGYALRIVERSRAHVENIIIKGNTKTKNEVILREIPLKPGDVFSRKKIMNGVRNLYNTQYFSSIVPEPVSGSEENLVDLVFNVEEQSTTSLQFGMTFTGISNPDDLPISLYAKIENSNFKGTGRSVSAGATISSSSQDVNLGYAQSWIKNQPISISESVSFSHSKSSALALNWLDNGLLDDDYYYMKYESWSTTLSSSIGRRFNPHFAILTLMGGISNTLTDNIYDESIYTPIDPSVSKNSNRFGLKNSIFANVSLDNRDINYDPSRGWFVSERIGWYGLMPGVEHEFYARSDTKLESYLKLCDVPLFKGYWNFKLVLAAYTGITTLYPVPGTMFGDSSKVYIDGMFNGRGWTDIYNDVRGKAMLSNRIELRLPIFQGVIGLAGFFDAVAVKDEPHDLLKLKMDDFYFSFGPGLRFLVPQFPLHLMFANKFRVIDGDVQWDDTWKFVLSFNIVNK